MAKLGMEARMTVKELARRGVSRCAIARTLGVTEGTVRYHLLRQDSGAVDGRTRRSRVASRWDEPIRVWLEGSAQGAALNLATLHQWLVGEYGYPGCWRSSGTDRF
jgi:transposase-like protein